VEWFVVVDACDGIMHNLEGENVVHEEFGWL
jgi:hypothetical protein